MAAAEDIAPKASGPSLPVQLAMLVCVTLLALGGGWATGRYLNGQGGTAAGEHQASGQDDEEAVPALTVVDLAPITTNLASPSGVWVRMEASLVFDAAPPPALTEDIHQDMLAFLRTVKLHQVEGASGFQHLKTDLAERATIRSGGQVKKVLIRTLLFE